MPFNDYPFEIIENRLAATGAYKMVLKTGMKIPPILGGQFLQLSVPGRPDLTLRRPFCICAYDYNTVTIVYAVVGKGTAAMADLQEGTLVKCVMPLGNGFILKESYKKVALIGGGLGVAPLLPVAANYPGRSFRAYLGFNSAAHMILHREFVTACGEVSVATDDGTFGAAGFPTDLLKADILGGNRPDVILTCGPEPMVRAVRNLAENHNIDAFMSGENRMGCGVGACLVCTCAVKDDKGEYHNLRACADGPVFDLKKIKL